MAFPSPAAADGQFVPAIQGLRGLAALSVLVVHLYTMPLLAGVAPPGFPRWLHDGLISNGRGVELFFILSGYLIPASLVRHASLPRFFHDRFLRIVPLFAILHLVLFTAGPLVGYKFFAGIEPAEYVRVFLANLFFVPLLVGAPEAQQNAWTLSYEWAFYLWFAAAYLAAVRMRSLALAVLTGAIGAAVVWHFPRAAYFALGMAFAWAPVRLTIGGAGGAAAGLLALTTFYLVCEYVSPFAGLVFGALVFALALHPGGGFARFLARRPLMFLGRISYSLYLVHPFVFFAALFPTRHAIGAGLDPWAAWFSFVAVAGVLAVAASAVSFELVEVRLRRRLDAMFRRRLNGGRLPLALRGR
ncbi:acyltransferase [Aureimonas sp. SK2]|uniref:acyltransferase family protein n=1 Tax=Aureimonas sp. SK2 TaxID=3015992 RepID=UPI00244455AA|nr:acyltransferase [Aureimonas sp. SK2]